MQIKKYRLWVILALLGVLFPSGILLGSVWKRYSMRTRQEDRYRDAVSMMEKKQFSDSLAAFQTLLQKTKSPRIRKNSTLAIARIYARQKKVLQAAKMYQSLLKGFSSDQASTLEAEAFLFHFNRLQGDTGNSIQIWKDMARSFPRSPHVASLGLMVGKEFIHQDRLVAARETLLKAYAALKEPLRDRKISNLLTTVNLRLLMEHRPSPFKQRYLVREGDNLYVIAKHFGTTVQLLKAMNQLSDPTIHPHTHLWVPVGNSSIQVDRLTGVLEVDWSGALFARYKVQKGRYGLTPSGTFQIINRRKDPIWYTSKGQIPPRSPENLLGAYWLGLSEPGIGIHGRPDTGPFAFDSRPTNGCISLKNSDLRFLYLISSIGTPVRIGDRLVSLQG